MLQAREKAASQIGEFLNIYLPWLSEEPYGLCYCDPVDWFQSIDKPFIGTAIAVMLIDGTPLYNVVNGEDPRVCSFFLDWLSRHYVYEIVDSHAILLVEEKHRPDLLT